MLSRRCKDCHGNILKVLVVEDVLKSHAALVRLLGHLGYEIKAACTLADALAQLQLPLQPPPDCIILDLMLPDGCGAEVLAEIRKRGLRTKVAVTTAATDADALQAVSALKPEAFFRKPLEIPDLLAWLRQCEHERGATRLPRHQRNAVA